MEHDIYEGTPWPIGTPEEIQAAGLSIKRRHSCAKPDPTNSDTDKRIKGCVLWDVCQFNMARRGGFKGKGPKYVGYRLITDGAEKNQAKHDFCSCFVFVETIQNRMIGAQHNKDMGRDFERVAIIAQEGETMKVERSLPINYKGNVTGPFLNAMPWIAKGLKEAGFAVELDDVSPSVDQRNFTFEIVVPKFPRPNQMGGLTFQASIIADEIKSNRDLDEREMKLWEMERAERGEKEVSGDDENETMLEMSLAEKPARGRSVRPE
jgi:hypothetical protein